MTRPGRFLLYAAIGWCADAAFSALHDKARGRRVTVRTSAWMLPIYGLIQPLYEPLHDAMRDRVPWVVRGAVYGVGFWTVEYSAGRLLRATRGEAPWDYSNECRNLHGLIRYDYFPLWAAAGLALEPLHDSLAPRASPVR